MGEKFKVSFTLDEEDAEYFRGLYRKVKKGAATQDPQQIIKDARDIVQRVRASKKTPNFVIEAIDVLADLVDLIQDEAYAAPQRVKSEVLAGARLLLESGGPDPRPGSGSGLPRRRDHGQVHRGGVQERALGLPPLPQAARFVRAAALVGARAAIACASAWRPIAAACAPRSRSASAKDEREEEVGALLRVVSRPPTPGPREPRRAVCRGSWSSTTRKPSSRR